MSNPDGMAALLSAQSEVKNQFAIVPFSVISQESGKTHVVMTSDDYIAPGSTAAAAYASARFHDPNPKPYAAVAAAFEEATAFINSDAKGAAEIFMTHEPRKRETAWVEKIIRDPKQISYSSTPRGIKEHADFMFRIGTLKTQAESWKDLFWDNMHGKDGS